MTRHFRDDRELARLLRAGDPASDGLDPDQAELQTWRRQTLNAVAENTGEAWRRTHMVALSGLAAATAVALAVLFLRPTTGPAEPGSQIAEAVTPTREETPVREAPQIALSQPSTRSTTETTSPIAQELPLLVGTSPPAEADTAEDDAQSQPARVATVATTPAVAVIPAAASRTLQFTAPEGTRIIWTLNPEFRLNLHGGSS